MEHTYHKKTFLSFTVGELIAGTLLACFCAVIFWIEDSVVPKFHSAPEQQIAQQNFPNDKIILSDGSLHAQAAIVYDLTNKRVMFAENTEMQLPLASLTKLMTADVAMDTIAATGKISISKEAVATEGESGIKAGSVWRLIDLLKYALTVSSNDAMAAVAESGGGDLFIKQMNDKAKTLGLSQSYFLDSTGLDTTQTVSGGYGSAMDVAKLASDVYLKYPEIFESTVQNGVTYSGTDNVVRGKPTAMPILDIPGLIGAKTGYTNLAGGNLVAVFDLSVGHPVVAVVLHSTVSGRFDDVRTLINATRAAQK